MAKLSVNLNKIAVLRNTRRTGVPDIARFAALAHEAGARGLTVHPRPDERHIRREDVFMLDALMRPWRPAFEFNIEGYPDQRFMELVAAVRPEQCTLVPDAPGVRLLAQLCEPILKPVRKIIPPIGQIDFSVLWVSIIIGALLVLIR